ncbi:LOW QUALITY PROTEIN: ATP synthase subunit a [Gastrolobium bilobum]|uniref:LOW QUALITY PROTEIN: ATP synthase subunit a n=1 Tax=Gastrolobium bilobum TaxID=150636 RepID=UPI002AB2192C|nr:LOW QUALITY PROTEIN: ATP synthase subunit a [Gastrolobium bilobum]
MNAFLGQQPGAFLFSKSFLLLGGAEQFKNEAKQMKLEWLFLTIAPCDAAEPWQLGFQDAATPMMHSPLDQFEIIPLIDMKIGDLYFSFTNPSLFMLLTLSLVLLLVHFVTKKGGGKSVPNAWQSLVELIYDFVPNLVNEQIGGLSGNVKQKFFPCISVTFTFSLFCNPQGMIPYSFTVTSHFLITLGLSFSIFIGITLVGFQRNGLHFLSFSLPAGVPLPLAPFLVLLELIPHCFRALSSGIRLFANMMAGHSSVKILSGFAWTMLCMNDLLYFIGDLGPLFIVLALTGPELGVAISQAHVSTISICIYLNDATNLHQLACYLFIIEQKRGAKYLELPSLRGEGAITATKSRLSKA